MFSFISPQTPDTFWSFKHVLRFVSKKAAFRRWACSPSPPCSRATGSSSVVDMNVNRLKDEDLRWADYVMISAMIVHKESVQEIVGRCAALGKPVIAGGPLFTTGHEAFPEIHAFRAGRSGGSHAATRRRPAERPLAAAFTKRRAGRSLDADARAALGPLDLRHYVTMAVQFSRGCPFDCEFCDIIVMNGRVPRTKTPAQLVAELEALRLRGWKDMVFIVDDNFIGDKRRTQDLAARDDRLAEADAARHGILHRGLREPGRRRRNCAS